MSNSTTEALRTKEQLTALADNLTKLNQIYGNMIQAIQGK